MSEGPLKTLQFFETSKLNARVRFPSPAPSRFSHQKQLLAGFFKQESWRLSQFSYNPRTTKHESWFCGSESLLDERARGYRILGLVSAFPRNAGPNFLQFVAPVTSSSRCGSGDWTAAVSFVAERKDRHHPYHDPPGARACHQLSLPIMRNTVLRREIVPCNLSPCLQILCGWRRKSGMRMPPRDV